VARRIINQPIVTVETVPDSGAACVLARWADMLVRLGREAREAAVATPAAVTRAADTGVPPDQPRRQPQPAPTTGQKRGSQR